MNIHDYMDRHYPGVTYVECGAEPGFLLRPCVGMRANEASHKWVQHWRENGICAKYQGDILITRSSPQKFVMSDGSQQS